MLYMEFADDLLNPVGDATPPIGVHVDNAAPLAQMAVGWRRASTPVFTPLGSFCPVVDRPLGADLEFKVDITVSAGHLRSIQLVGGGCGGRPRLTSVIPALWEAIGPAAEPWGMQHWHIGPLDNGAALSTIFRLSWPAPRGVYSFSLWADTRGFNPAGGDGGFEADWNYNPLYRFSNPVFTFAVNDIV